MAEEQSVSAVHSGTASNGSRLDSWKEIAAYLHRDVTTVRRWEKRERLPVHRHVHDKLGSVYAYGPEIDAWWEGRRHRLDHAGSHGGNGTPAAPADEPPMAPQPGRERLAWTLAIVLFMAAAGGAVTLVGVYLGRSETESSEVRFPMPPPDGAAIAAAAVSPDGRHIAFTTSTPDGAGLLWIRPLESVDALPVPGTEGAAFPFWSPDGRHIGFFARRRLKTVDRVTRAVRELCDAPDGHGGTWNQDGVILFAADRGQPLSRISVTGGPAARVTTVDGSYQRGHNWPEFLPDGRHFLYLDRSADRGRYGVYVGDLETGHTRRLVATFSNASYVASGYLLFKRQDVLVAQRFDARRLELSGEPIAVASFVLQQYGLDHKVDFSVSRAGTLAFREGATDVKRLVWVDRAGRVRATVGEPAQYGDPALSPDGTRAAVRIFNPDPREGRADIWLFDLATGARSRFTFDRAVHTSPVWSPDGRRIVFTSTRRGRIEFYQKAASGAGPEELMLAFPGAIMPEAWSRDGRFLTYSALRQDTKLDVWSWPLLGDRRPYSIAQTEHNESQSQISPDGRLIVYTSDESGRWEVYARTFPASHGKWQVSTRGGGDARWRRDGTELYYVAADRMLMAVPVKPGGGFGAPHPLFDTRVEDLWEDSRNHYDVAPDGQHFLVAMPVADPRTLPFTVVLNWQAGRR